MPFQENPLQFHRADTEKLVSFKDRIDGPPPWAIDSITTVFTISGRPTTVRLKRERWGFLNVGQDTTDSNKVVGTLRYTPSAIADPTLDALWTQIPAALASATLTFNVICNGQSRPLTVQLVP